MSICSLICSIRSSWVSEKSYLQVEDSITVNSAYIALTLTSGVNSLYSLYIDSHTNTWDSAACFVSFSALYCVTILKKHTHAQSNRITNKKPNLLFYPEPRYNLLSLLANDFLINQNPQAHLRFPQEISYKYLVRSSFLNYIYPIMTKISIPIFGMTSFTAISGW